MQSLLFHNSVSSVVSRIQGVQATNNTATNNTAAFFQIFVLLGTFEFLLRACVSVRVCECVCTYIYLIYIYRFTYFLFFCLYGEGPPMRPHFGLWNRSFFLTKWLQLRVALGLRVTPQFWFRVVLYFSKLEFRVCTLEQTTKVGFTFENIWEHQSRVYLWEHQRKV